MLRKKGALVWICMAVLAALLIVKHFVAKDNKWPLYLDEDAYFFGGEGSHICNPRQLLCERKRDQLFDGLQKVEAQELIHRAMTKLTIRCRNIHMFGVRGHGGFEACMDPPFGFEKNNCLVYSFGVSNGYTFEEAIINEYGCEVHTFDPVVDMSTLDDVNLPNWTFHKIGIWGDDFENTEGHKMRRLPTIVKMLGHEDRIIDIIKLDGQGAEWPFFRDLAIHHASLENVKQFVLHANAPRRKPRNQVMRMSDYSQVFRSISMVTKLGFRRYHYHAADMAQSCCNWWADLVHSTISGAKVTICCYQSFFVNMNFAKPSS